MRVVVNLAISHRRGLLARFRHAVPPAVAPDPSSVAIAHVEGQRMRHALFILEPRERAILALRFGRDLGFAEIGNMLGQPEATVRTICHRSLQKLRRRLGDEAVQRSNDQNPKPDVAVKL